MIMRAAIRSLVLVILLASVSEAQFGVATSVTAIQPMQFGQLIPAVAEHITTAQNWRRGEVRLQGTGLLQVRFVLPTHLRAVSGATIPLSFAAQDGAYQVSNNPRQFSFDPNRTLWLWMPAGTTTQLMLGGTATPSNTQIAGNYSATIAVVLAPATF